jgi:hypothetical protein
MKSFVYFNLKKRCVTIEMIKVKTYNLFLGLFEFNIIIYTSQHMMHLILGLSFGVWAQSKCYIYIYIFKIII